MQNVKNDKPERTKKKKTQGKTREREDGEAAIDNKDLRFPLQRRL
jgi:hypothetical protein